MGSCSSRAFNKRSKRSGQKKRLHLTIQIVSHSSSVFGTSSGNMDEGPLRLSWFAVLAFEAECSIVPCSALVG